MEIFSQTFSMPKFGCMEEEYEDAYSYASTGQPQCYRFAIADGATETSFSGLWANMLVNEYCNTYVQGSSILGLLPKIQREWNEKVCSKSLPWYAEEKVKKGAFSTFLGLYINSGVIDTSYCMEWDAIAIGDSCLCQVRENEIIISFPIEKSEHFNNSPVLISSIEENNVILSENLMSAHGRCGILDSLFLMTDALACWFLQSCERGEKPWVILRDLGTSDEKKAFNDLINDLRKSKLIRNDDVTLLRIDILSV